MNAVGVVIERDFRKRGKEKFAHAPRRCPQLVPSSGDGDGVCEGRRSTPRATARCVCSHRDRLTASTSATPATATVRSSCASPADSWSVARAIVRCTPGARRKEIVEVSGLSPDQQAPWASARRCSLGRGPAFSPRLATVESACRCVVSSNPEPARPVDFLVALRTSSGQASALLLDPQQSRQGAQDAAA